MILFYSFIAIVTGSTIIISPVMGLFFYAILLYSCYLKHCSLFFKFALTAVAVLSAYVYYTADNDLAEDTLHDITIDGYKYYTDSIHYLVSNKGKKYELYDEAQEAAIPIGYKCSGILPVKIPSEQRNFIKKDGVQSLQINELSGRIYVDNAAALNCLPADLTLQQVFNKLRHSYMTKVLSATEYDYKFDMLTLSVGNKNYISSDFFDALQKLGIYHLYVISGTHVAFLSAVIFAVLKFFKLPLNTIKILIILSLILFLCMNFFSPSVLRAVFMGVLLLISSFFKKKPYLAIISLSAIIQLLINPYVMFHAGFQLSYVTTYFILLTRPLFMQYSGFIQLILVTVISELSTLAIILIHFNEVSISGLILNIVFVPLFSFIIFPGIIIFNVLNLFYFPPFIDEIYQWISTFIKCLIYLIADNFKHRLPIKNLSVLSLIILLFITYRMTLHALFFKFKKIALSILIFTAVLVINHQEFNKQFTVTMVDVGQGDAFVIQDHRNYKTVLIDTGGEFQLDENRIKLSEKTLLPYLKEQGIDFIDLIIISHLDIDHSGEVIHVVNKKKTGNIIMNTQDVKFDEWAAELEPEIRNMIVDSSQLDSFQTGDIQFSHLQLPETEANSNEQSVVLQVQLNRFSVLFTGDIGLSTEKNLIKHYNLKSDILKVGHHGSDTSTGEEFKNEVNPVISLISAGENNRYGHPHDSVTERLRDTRILGTNTLGMVEFSINHDTICIRAKLAPDQDECLKKDIKKEPDSRP